MNEAQLEAANSTLATRLYQRADLVALQTLEAMEVWAQLADQPTNPSCVAARQQLARFSRVMDRARAVAHGIQIADQLPGGGNGRDRRPDPR